MFKVVSPEGQSWCKTCKSHKPASEFSRGDRYNGLNARCRGCGNRNFNLWKAKNREKCRTYQRLWQQSNDQKSKKVKWAKDLKSEVIFNYGGKCACCGETEFAFLSIDHINGDGGEHRAEIKRHGTGFYVWLKKNNYPKDRFQLLCMNCNFAKGKYGDCPHKRQLLVAI